MQKTNQDNCIDDIKGWFTLRPKSQVPLMLARKSQHGRKVPNFEPQETIKIGLNMIKVIFLFFYGKTSMGLVLRA